MHDNTPSLKAVIACFEGNKINYSWLNENYAVYLIILGTFLTECVLYLFIGPKDISTVLHIFCNKIEPFIMKMGKEYFASYL